VPPKYPAAHEVQLLPFHPVLQDEQVPSPVLVPLQIPLRHVHGWQLVPK